MEHKFKIGDVVHTKPGFSHKSSLESRYAGFGYRENLKFLKIDAISRVDINSKNTYMYRFEKVKFGIFEDALVSQKEIREEVLNKLLKE